MKLFFQQIICYIKQSSCNMFIFFHGLTQDLCYHPSSNSSTDFFTSRVEEWKAPCGSCFFFVHIHTCGSFLKPICQQITNKTHPDHCRCWKWFLLLCTFSSTSVKCSHSCMEVPSQKPNRLEIWKLKPRSPVQST